MTKPAAKERVGRGKPKFRVGQVVAVRKGYMSEGQYFQILGFRQGKDVLHAVFAGMSEAAIYAIRPLSKRESGQ